MRLLCASCASIFRTRRRDISTVQCPHCGVIAQDIFELKPKAYIKMENVKLRYAR